ncbi:MAG: discoidin domain-containing protein [Planctomycetes bacterium]|nr:discoidin domain-containing protein [Planctomycetota bacterium]
MRRIVVLMLVVASCGIGGAQETKRPRPVQALLITGGCCHDYAKQKEILKKGIESRAMVEVTLVHSSDSSTKARFDMYDSPDWAKGYDVVIHDECSADVKEMPYVDNILSAHKNGVAAVNLHCAMHCYRTGTDDWFKFVGIHSTGHGPQKPIDITFLDRVHPISKELENWTTINEELYNNVKLFDTTVPLARGRQDTGNKVEDFVVAWANQFGKARVFSTTLGHNNETVGDPRYLDLVTRGLLWSVDRLTPEYQQPFAVPRKELVPVNLARGKKATATGSQDGHPPEHAIDGKDETRWCSPDGSPGQSWQVDLGEAQELTGCQIQWEMDDTNYRYKIEGSSDGQTWQMLSDQTKTDLKEQIQTLKFAVTGIRYVRLTITGLTPGRWGSFFEFEVHGTKMEERTVSSSDSFKPKSTKGTGLLAGIKVPTGFEVTLFAAPPQVSYPVCLAADPDGTVYVGIDENGSLDKKPGRGKIVRCQDADGDGQADKFVEFTRIDSPRGIVVTAGQDPNSKTLYVLHPPHLSRYDDDNGDGVADRSQILVKNVGFDLNFRGADHTTNGIQIGIDGWIYVAVGDYGFIKATGTDGRDVQMKGGGIARVRPDGSELELVSRGQRNIYDVAISPLMDLFTRDNTNDGGGWNVRLSYVPQGAQMGYPSLFVNFPDEIVQPLADYGGGSPCGSLFVDEPTLPGELGQSLYTCDWGRSVIYRHPLTPSGAGFTAEQESFVELPRPTDMEIDGSGNLYISSWRDGGFNFSNPNVGYVVKVKPPRQTAVPLTAPSVHGATVTELLKLMASPSHTLRLQAQREILRGGDKLESVNGLKLLAASAASLPVRVAAVFTLKQLQGEKSHPALLALASDVRLREHVLRTVADRETQLAMTPVEPFVEAFSDPNPRVRMQAARGLGRFRLTSPTRLTDAVAKLIPLTVDRDPLVAHIAIDSLVRLNAGDACLAVLGSNSEDVKPGAARVVQRLHDAAVVSGLLQLLQRPALTPATRLLVLSALCRLHYREADYTGDWWGTRPDTSGPYYKHVTWSESERIAAALQRELVHGDSAVIKQLLRTLRHNKLELPGTQERIVKLAGEDREFFSTAADLIAAGSTNLSNEAAQLLEVAATINPTDTALRAMALRGLQRRVEQPALFEHVIRSFAAVKEQDQQGEVAAAWNEFVREPKLGRLVAPLAKEAESADAATRELAYAALTSVAESPQAARDARDAAMRVVERAWAKPETAASLLRAIGRSKIESQILQIQLHLKSETPSVKDAALYAMARLELDKEPPLDPKKPQLATLKYEDLVSQTEPMKGDAKYGQRLFSRQGCVACHTVSQSEPIKGPLLLDIAKRYKRHELIESIVKPSAKIAQGFESQYFATSEGKVYEGFVVRESGEEIELRNVAGISIILKKDDIEERGKRDISVMPLGLVDKLNAEQLAAILAYLESLKK